MISLDKARLSDSSIRYGACWVLLVVFSWRLVYSGESMKGFTHMSGALVGTDGNLGSADLFSTSIYS